MLLKTALRRRPGLWLIAVVVGFLGLLSAVALLALSGWFITAAGLAGLSSLATAHAFNYPAPSAMIRFFAIARTAGRYGERMASHNAVLALLADLRTEIFARVAQKPAAGASWQHAHRLTEDVDTLNLWPLAVVLPRIWVALLLLLWMLVVGLNSPLVLAAVTPWLLGAWLLPLWAGRRAQSWAEREAEAAEARKGALVSPLSALTALLQWRIWPRFAARFSACDGAFLAQQTRAATLALRITTAQQILLLGAGVTLLSLGLPRFAPPWLLAFFLALLGLAEQLLGLGATVLSGAQARAAETRVLSLLTEESPQKTEPVPLPAGALQLQVEGLSGRRTGAVVGPEHLSFELHSGEALIVSGASGCGKSTLLALLAEELLPTAGHIRLNGQALSHWDLRRDRGFLAQNPALFDLSLEENLRLAAPEVSAETMTRLLTALGLGAWLAAQPQGLKTPLGEYGAAISGGQARRLALAQVLLRAPRLLLLDEPFAGLDAPLKQKLYDYLRAEQRGILILVSHETLDWGEGARLLSF